MNISITVSGTKELISKYHKFKDALEDWTGELTDITSMMKTYYSQAVFATEGGVYGNPWPAVKPGYEYYKRTHAMQFGILQFSGTMQGNFESKATRNEAEVWNSTPYFKYHQSKKPRKVLPRRAMIEINAFQKDKIRGIFKQGMNDKIRRIF